MPAETLLIRLLSEHAAAQTAGAGAPQDRNGAGPKGVHSV